MKRDCGGAAAILGAFQAAVTEVCTIKGPGRSLLDAFSRGLARIFTQSFVLPRMQLVPRRRDQMTSTRSIRESTRARARG